MLAKNSEKENRRVLPQGFLSIRRKSILFKYFKYQSNMDEAQEYDHVTKTSFEIKNIGN